MSSSKRQSLIMAGIALLLISGILYYHAFSLPKVSVETIVVETEANEMIENEMQEDNNSFTSGSSKVVYNSSTGTGKASASSGNMNSNKNADSNEADKNKENSESYSYPLNLNTCSEEALTSINGIGPSRANAIIQYRDYLGGYESVDQIKNIKGIGDKLYEKLKPYLTV